ncbi:MAG: hypothetical protein ACRDSH_03860, partial [Pseudonocardiaceae bacterium]
MSVLAGVPPSSGILIKHPGALTGTRNGPPAAASRRSAAGPGSGTSRGGVVPSSVRSSSRGGSVSATATILLWGSNATPVAGAPSGRTDPAGAGPPGGAEAGPT